MRPKHILTKIEPSRFNTPELGSIGENIFRMCYIQNADTCPEETWQTLYAANRQEAYYKLKDDFSQKHWDLLVLNGKLK